MEDILEYIGYAAVLLFWLLPRLIKVLGRGRSSAPRPAPRPAKRAPAAPAPAPKPVFEIERSFADVDDEPDSERIARLARTTADARALVGRAEDVVRLCRVRGGAAAVLVDTADRACLTPAARLLSDLERHGPAGLTLAPDDEMRHRAEIDRLDRLISMVELMVSERVAGANPAFIDTMDDVANDCLLPFLTHAKLLGLAYPTIRAMTVVADVRAEAAADLLDSASVAPVVVLPADVDRPVSWVQIASDVALDVFHSARGLSRELASRVGVSARPTPVILELGQGGVLSSAASHWLPRIFADAAAGLMLGASFAAGLAGWWSRERDAESVVGARFDGSDSSGLLPPYLRVFVACRALQHLGSGEDAAERWKRWYERSGEPDSLAVAAFDGRVGRIPMDRVLKAVAKVVDVAVREPLESLGGYPLGRIPRVALGEEDRSLAEALAGRFALGEAVVESPRAILTAVPIAVERSSTFEQRVRKTALRSLRGEGERRRAPAGRDEPDRAPGDMAALLGSPDVWARAVVVGAAFAPARLRAGRP